MAAIQSRKMNWVRTPSAYEANVAWSQKRKAARADFEQSRTLMSNAFLGAQSDQIDGIGTLIGQKALQRVIEEGKAKTARQAELAKLDTTVDSFKADTKDSIFSGETNAELDSGTSINLKSGTITLSDGTMIDIKTGVKRVNLVT